MWTSIIQEADAVYFPDEPKRPTRLSSESKNIKENLLKYREKNCKFLCEISSVKGTRVGSFYDIEESPYIYPICSLINPTDEVNNNIDVISNSVKSCIMDAFQVCRKKATEVLVWILADTDRIFSKGIPYALPVAYAMKGYSLGTQVMREMHEHVLQACYEKNLRVVASCFDGQWTKLATRDKKGKPLTEMQLQRDVYGDASKMSRDAIVRKLTSESIIDVEKSNLQIKKTNFGLTVSCQRLKRIMQSLRNKLRKTKTSIAPNEEDDTTSCLPDEALETLLDEDNSTQINSMFNLQNPSEAEEVKEVLDDSNNSRTVNPKIPEETVELILLNLKSHSNRNVSKKWTNKTINEMKETLVSRHLLMKMQHDEMNVVIEATKVLHNMGSKMIRKSCSREEKAKQIKKMFVGREDETWEKTVKKMMPLKCIASTIVRGSSTKIPKERLNNTVAAMLYDTKYDEWREESTFKLKTRIENADTTKWFSFPEFSEERQQIEPKCLDAHHLLVNLRCKVCKDGLVGIRKEAWHQVAEKNNAVISNAIVVDLVDKQNNAFAKRTFSKAVEDEMRKLKYSTEADFCRLIRQWYESEDSGGIAAIERVQRKLELKSFLLKDVDFGIFPPPGMYIKGFPKVMFEGFIQRIDTSIQLYDIVKGQSYNQRSLSSLVNETFFGELSELEPTKLGCPKAVSIPCLMANVTEMQHFRCDPSNRYLSIFGSDS